METKKTGSFLSGGTIVLLVLMAIGAYAAIYRFAFGLGASTDLQDNFPWGLWVGFDVLSGVALAAGGFTVTAAVYIFNMKKYKPIARPAVLTAFIGYLMVIVGLIVDIGKPLSFWHPLVMWNHHSIMFEVVWCITLYTTVLALEFSSAFLEKWGWTGALKVMKGLTFPLVIAGIILSYLHQSSLGAFFLIVPAKLNPIWYSPIIPQLFYLSAIALGLAMVTFESVVSARAFGREQEKEIVSGLGKGTSIALLVYLAVRVADLIVRGAMPMVFQGGAASTAFLIEIVVGVVLPMILLSMKSTRESVNGTLLSVSLVIAGIVMNRFNVTFFAQTSSGASYFPTWKEFAITIGLVSLAIFLYRLAAMYLPVFHPAGAKTGR
ncbi:MAG: Ni/Fe-hydrogenase cytochrome b subunit [Nitrospiraceae bacterium]|nr:Ni/Fe-hydrogenase cytochrome b subunit [Nitrospiraceae bacterium]